MSRHLFPQRGYDDDKAFVSAGRIAVSPIFLCVNPKVGVKDIAGLVARQGSAGQDELRLLRRRLLRHLATELFLRSAGIEIENA